MNNEHQETSDSYSSTVEHHQQQQEVAKPSSSLYSPQSYPLPQPSPLHRRSISSIGRGRTNNNDNSPLLIRRRALSCTDGEAAQQSQRQGNSSQPYCLPTIHSRCEMDDDSEKYASEGRNSIYSTPTRKTQKSYNRRTRAASSSDIVLNISSSDNLPRYDDELASCIDSISDGDIYNEELQHEQDELFATPERSSNYRNSPSRDRANTCPHRPQQHSMFEFDYNGIEGDEESGHQFHLELEERSSSEQSPTPDNGFLSRAFTPERRRGESISLNDSYSSSPERRSHSTSSIPPAAPAVPNLRMPASLLSPRSSSRRPSSAPTPTHRERSASITTIPSSPASINRLSNRAPPPTTSNTTSIPLTATQRAHATAQNFIFRINPHVMKALMTLSLYMLLAYTWNTDLLINRAKSMEINYGLSEYWNGAEKIGRVSTDDEGGEIVTKLLVNGKLDSSSSRSGDAAISAGEVSPSQDDGTPSFSIMDIEKGKVRRPNLSYARSIDGKLTTYGVNSNQRRAMMSVARKKSSSSKYEWTFSRLAWAFVWLGFSIPLVEMGIREIRRQINIRFWNVRRLRPLRAIPSRVYVHNS